RVRHPRRKARCRRFVPGPQPEFPAPFADLILFKAEIGKRAYDALVDRRRSPRTVIAQVVGIRAVKNRGDPALACDGGELFVKLRFAVKAAVAEVRPIV